VLSEGGKNDLPATKYALPASLTAALVLEAWHIDNLVAGKEFTIKGEGRPPWAGGPKGLVIYPWPPSDKDD